jgi:sec-independent protein translocase protein TatA
MWDSPFHLLIIAIVILVLFGGPKIPQVMRGLGQGIREFKDGMRENPNPTPTNNPPATTATNAPSEEKKG